MQILFGVGLPKIEAPRAVGVKSVEMNVASGGTIYFDQFAVDLGRRMVLQAGEPLPLNPKAFDLLLALIEKEGEPLSKDELLDRVWPGQFVEENNLTVHISALRKLFGEKKNEPRY